jgi:hypothetical protein
MQIHEITRRRTDENILSGIGNKIASSGVGQAVGRGIQAVGRGVKQAGAIAGGVANYAANATLDAAGIGGKFDTTTAAPGQAQDVAAKLSAPLIDSTAKDVAKRWQQTEASLAAEIGTTDPNSGEWQKVNGKKEEALDQIINQSLLRQQLAGGYQSLPQAVQNVPQLTGPAAELVKAIDQAKAKIMANNGKANMQDSFKEIVKSAFQATTYMQSMKSKSRAGLTQTQSNVANQLQSEVGLSRSEAEDVAASIATIRPDKVQKFNRIVAQIAAANDPSNLAKAAE